ncbi:MAG: hypothetical protein QOH20_3676, partial [Mycobacterium sp.]|nr:hypothetical protein [Mycobacterium sp.]
MNTSRNRANQYKSATLSVAILAALGALGAPATAAADPLPYGPDTCIQGFVWREAGPGDIVCVTPAVRSSTAQQNQAAGQNREPDGGAYGPDTCKQGFVWREAFGGDVVCVTVAVECVLVARSLVHHPCVGDLVWVADAPEVALGYRPARSTAVMSSMSSAEP